MEEIAMYVVSRCKGKTGCDRHARTHYGIGHKTLCGKAINEMWWTEAEGRVVTCPQCRAAKKNSACKEHLWPRPALVFFTDFSGRWLEHKCNVIGETPKKYRITVDKPVALPTGYDILLPGMTRLVPKYAIKFI